MSALGAACANYAVGQTWGNATVNALTEASGLAASARNPGVLWVNNDGSRQSIYALSTNGALLATFDLGNQVNDLEDIAVGPGPVSGVSYLYVGDIGGNGEDDGLRGEVEILRLPEPAVSLTWESDPVEENFEDVSSLFFLYPDGRYDAEALMVDPVSGEIWIATKQSQTRLYRVSPAGLDDGDEAALVFVRSVSFGQPSAGDISPTGDGILLRREEAARLWPRAVGESVGDAMGRTGTSVPVIGLPAEPNGEAVAFLRDGTGYVTLSEGEDPPLYYFQALCPRPPEFTLAPTNRVAFAGENVVMAATAVGYPPPHYQWSRDGDLLPGRTNAWLDLEKVEPEDAGLYEVVAANSQGTASALAELSVRLMPDLRITEVQSAPSSPAGVATSDWWELTSYENQPVDLSGWRFNDNDGGLDDPFELPEGLVIEPGQSIVFVEELSAAAFRQWWGTANVPASVPVVTYAGNGLGLSANGDGIRVWNDFVTDPAQWAASVDFGGATDGVTFTYDPPTAVFGGLSRLGFNGVVLAAAAPDLGSPGRILAPASSPGLSISRVAPETISVEFGVDAGRFYRLQSRGSIAQGDWIAATNGFVAIAQGTAQFELATSPDRRFFRVVVE